MRMTVYLQAMEFELFSTKVYLNEAHWQRDLIGQVICGSKARNTLYNTLHTFERIIIPQICIRWKGVRKVTVDKSSPRGVNGLTGIKHIYIYSLAGMTLRDLRNLCKKRWEKRGILEWRELVIDFLDLIRRWPKYDPRCIYDLASALAVHRLYRVGDKGGGGWLHRGLNRPNA
jgi:hypothetical protein